MKTIYHVLLSSQQYFSIKWFYSINKVDFHRKHEIILQKLYISFLIL